MRGTSIGCNWPSVRGCPDRCTVFGLSEAVFWRDAGRLERLAGATKADFRKPMPINFARAEFNWHFRLISLIPPTRSPPPGVSGRQWHEHESGPGLALPGSGL